MPTRQVQIDRRVGQLGVSEQHLDGAEIGTRFKQLANPHFSRDGRVRVISGWFGADWALGAKWMRKAEDFLWHRDWFQSHRRVLSHGSAGRLLKSVLV